VLRESREPNGGLAYRFKHALIQDAAYSSLLKSRRQQYHGQSARALEARFPEIAETQPELLAGHYAAAGQFEAAISYWGTAGNRALARSANQEAVAHFTQGLALLAGLPETPERMQQELPMQTSLGVALMATQGYGAPEAGEAFQRAEALCQALGETQQLFQMAPAYGERAMEVELHWVKGRLLLTLAEPDRPAAEGSFRHAIDLARRCGARSQELQATMDLGRLLRGEERQEEARQMLAGIYGWFTEGFETADLREAAALLREWS
jgi:tetratricopeptide (TPR) repeat protein